MEQKYINLKNQNINLFFDIFTSLKNDDAFNYDIVLKKYRGLGYGKILLQKGISLLLENNCNIVILEVLKINESVVKLYKDEKFKIKNEIVSFRNENNSFYKNLLNKEYKVIKPGSYSFHVLHKIFHKQPQPWQKKIKHDNKKGNIE